ncbi:hypothetical protein CLAFUW4_14025 [Fulvia fulva]|uniref:Uncharacterized protein n=1 Tax=Passalora fulva TaxID=5499 RepID=A0A9Q8UW60_PASFU|nr:uncharacterized protein CLAFUR5_13865 [Fulvia fulva]KAK4610172.1 hypothetical protein CLAFUR4_14028 [Fulvia fulva]KAK4610787.1 hypothetical protein CLAFUR0_14032 [Fulvia fulva]UJO24567.1 hypothetical protein CLAFUR5_13865 [Fulvia fulva]WPV22218.1 hypothetical protein CLAFUW4_14025 [Fulvia fulva]WPV37317.1 hypothetical protein CLAFUW7_14036 [Fulvia fulva]
MASNSTSISTTMSSAAESSSSAAPSTTAASSTSVSSVSSVPSVSSVDTSSIAESISSAVSSSIASPTSTSAEPTSNTAIVSTATISESSIPPTTAVVTSVVTRTPTSPGETPVVVTVTATNPPTNTPITTGITSTGRTSATSSSPALNTGGSGNGGNGGGGGLSTAGTTAVAVVVPVAVVALLVLGGIFFWRKRKAKKASEEQRRKEIEDYGFNPNNDPTLPAVASDNGAEMAEDTSGYRGWGAATGSNRKMSTTLSGGHTQGQLSDAGSNTYGSQLGPGSASPTGGNSDGHSADPLMHQRRETMNSDVGSLGAIGGAPVAGTAAAGVGVKRGPSNASSTYSVGNHSDVSDGPPPGGLGMSQSYEAYNPNGFGYSQHGPYGDGTYGGAQQDGNGMPVVRDVSARRNTRIQQPGNYQQGNSGIAQNF